MATLTREEQARVDEWTALKQQRAAGQYVSDYDLTRAETIAANQIKNAELREQRLKGQEATRQAEAARVQAEQEARHQAAQEAYKRVARARFPGDDEQFQQAWPQLLREWQIRQATAEMDAATASTRQFVRKHF
jgi:hypothetical protein